VWVVKWKNTMFILLPLFLVGVGMIIAGVLVDPASKTSDGHSAKWFFLLFGCFWLLSVFGTLGGMILYTRHQVKKYKYFSEKGLKGVAKLLSCETTGTEINNIPQYEMQLQIIVEGRQPYVITHKECLNHLIAGKITIGLEIPVMVDPQRERSVILEWDELMKNT
jgi:hypothetical protein